MSKDRVETFSDAVFAIILTLLILEIHVPNIPEHASLAQYAVAMNPLIPKILSFIFSFIIITIGWVSHHYFFNHIKSSPLGLVWLNNLFLLWMCFVPFPTAMLGDHPTDQFPILLYAVNQLLTAITFLGFGSYAKKKNLFVNKASAKAMAPKFSVPAIVAFSLAFFLAFVNVYLSLLCFLIVPLLYFASNIMRLNY